MNALFGTTIKFCLTLLKTNYAVGEDDGDSAKW